MHCDYCTSSNAMQPCRGTRPAHLKVVSMLEGAEFWVGGPIEGNHTISRPNQLLSSHIGTTTTRGQHAQLLIARLHFTVPLTM